MSSTDEDYINTQILDTDNTALAIGQDIIVTAAVTELAERAVYGTVYQLGGKQALQATSRQFDSYFTKEIMEKLTKTASQKISTNSTRSIATMFSKGLSKTIVKALGKSAATAATKAGIATAGGCALGPAGCLAGSAVGAVMFIADMSFTIYATILDIQDKKGLMILWHRDYVDNIANDYKFALENAYAKMGLPDYMNEEVLFTSESFVFDYEDDGTPYLDTENEWAQKYIQYRNEYFESIGVKPGWEDHIQANELSKSVGLVNRIDDDDDDRMKKKTVAVGVIVGGVLFALIFIILVIFIFS
jgi:hypothetical protein